MQCTLTVGIVEAVSFFQNRYKSILCQEDTYLLELVRYIHLNPIRAGMVPDIKTLDKHAFCGHAVIMGKKIKDWQDDPLC